jgi:serine/threonine protein kinase/Tol biopolymer transport system component
MGEVYKARDTRLERTVAVKVLPADKVADAARKQRFIQEARAASALNHPNIVVVHDIAEDANRAFLVMEYVAGKTLQQIIPRRGMHLGDVLKYGVQIADAIAAAHAAGIVHRDLKPSNVMVNEQGRVKVLDFGLAKLTEQIGEEQQTRTVHTDPGTVVGSAPYMSPEQAEGKTVDARSDIFSFGAVMYEMVTGRKAFAGDSPVSIMAAVLKEEPHPAKDLVEGLPRELERIVLRCLRKDVARRSQSMAEIKLALEELKEESDSGTLPVASLPSAVRPRRAFLFGAITLAAVLIAAAGAWMIAARRDHGPPLYRLRQITRDEGITTSPALSLDGKLLAYASDRAGENHLNIWVQQVSGGDAIRLTHGPTDDDRPRFSPDGSQVLFSRGADIYLIPALGGSERLLVKSGLRPEFSPDGKWIAYFTGQNGSRESWGMYVVSTTAGGPRKLETGLAFACCPMWSPDGKQLLVQGQATGALLVGRTAVGFLALPDWFLVPSDGGKATKVSQGPLHLLVLKEPSQSGAFVIPPPAAWIGNRLIFGAGIGRQDLPNIWEVTFANGVFSGRPRRLTAGSGEYPGPAAIDGRIPFSTATASATIYALPMDTREGKATGELVRAVNWGANASYPTVTADGKKLVFVSDRYGTSDVWMKDLTTGDETVLIGTPDEEMRAMISPDGSQVAFYRLEGRANYVWPFPAGPEKKLCESCPPPLNWTADSKSLVIPEGDPFRFVALNVTTGQRIPLAAHPEYPVHDGSLSPDGRWFVFKLVVSNTVQPIFIAPVREGSPASEHEWIKISGDNFNYKPFWSPDGSIVYYYSEQDHFRCLYARRVKPETKRPEGQAFAVRHFHDAMRCGSPVNVGYGIAPDRLYIPMISSRSNVWLAEPEKSH